MEFIWIFLTLAFTAVFTAAALSKGKVFGAKSRLDLILAAVDAIVVLAVARVVAPWGTLSPWLWLVPVAILAAGSAGSILAWSSLPVLRTDKPARRTIVFATIHVLVATAIVMQVFVL